MQEEAVLRFKRSLHAPSVGYEQFRQMAWTASQDIARTVALPRGVVPIRALRHVLKSVPAEVFNQHLVRLERNGLVYLIPPEDPEALGEDERQESLLHPAGDLRSFVLWMSPSPRRTRFSD